MLPVTGIHIIGVRIAPRKTSYALQRGFSQSTAHDWLIQSHIPNVTVRILDLDMTQPLGLLKSYSSRGEVMRFFRSAGTR